MNALCRVLIVNLKIVPIVHITLRILMPPKLPYPLMPYFGKKYYRFNVRLKQSGLARDYWERSQTVQVIAPTPSASCNLVKDEFAPVVEHPTEIECLGPKGGITSRFIGYESLIWAKMSEERGDWKQLKLL